MQKTCTKTTIFLAVNCNITKICKHLNEENIVILRRHTEQLALSQLRNTDPDIRFLILIYTRFHHSLFHMYLILCNYNKYTFCLNFSAILLQGTVKDLGPICIASSRELSWKVTHFIFPFHLCLIFSPLVFNSLQSKRFTAEVFSLILPFVVKVIVFLQSLVPKYVLVLKLYGSSDNEIKYFTLWYYIYLLNIFLSP